MKRLILSAYKSGSDEFRQFITYCDLLKNIYAKAHEVDYFFFRCDEKIDHRHFNWVQIPLIRKYSELYDEILWLDADIVIKDHTSNLFEVMKRLEINKSWGSTDPFVFCMGDDDIPSSCALLIECSNKEKLNVFLNDWWNDATTDQLNIPFTNLVWSKVWGDGADKSKQLRIQVSEKIPTSETTTLPFFKLIESNQLVRIPIAKKYFYKTILKIQRAKKIALVLRRQNFYSNGAGQNCIFMKHTLEALGHIVDIVSCDEEGIANPELPYYFKNFKSITLEDYELFIFGSQIPPESIIKAIRQKGIKCVMFNPANVVDGFHQENFLYKEKASETPLFEMKFRSICDEVWSLESHFESSYDYLQIVNRQEVPIIQVPLLWSPLFIYKDDKIPVYQPRANGAKVDLVILEPNSSYCKSGWLPLVICEKFYLDNPQLVNKIYFFNSQRLNETAKGMISSLRLSEDKKIRLMERMPINDILTFFADPAKNGGNHVVFVSHNINVPLNYAYFDVLYCGFPLIHNSSYLVKADIGFYYNRLFEGAEHINKSISDFKNDEYLKKSRKYLYNFDDYNTINIQKFDRLLQNTNFKKEIKERLVIYIITTNKERKETMMKMIKDLDISYEVKVFEGHTPADSKDYLSQRPNKYNEPDSLICCSRSHIAAIKSFVNTYSDRDYLLVLEDDVRLLKNNFEEELSNVINLWEKHDDIDYLSIGYLPGNRSASLFTDGCLHWGLQAPKTGVWGTQSYLVKKTIAQQMAAALDQPNALKLYDAIFSYLYDTNKGVAHCNKIICLSPDHFLPLCWRQGYVSPMLVKEDPQLSSTIFEAKNKEQHEVQYDVREFYSTTTAAPAPTLQIIEE